MKRLGVIALSFMVASCGFAGSSPRDESSYFPMSSRRVWEYRLSRFAQGEVSRDEARKERLVGEKERPQNFVFRFRPPTKEFTLDLKFSKSNVEREELIEVLSSILKALKEETVSGDPLKKIS